jgi:hypothetical protein
MRLPILLAAACLCISAQALAQTTQGGSAIAVPPAPPIMAAPLAAPATPTPPAAAAPPGLVQTPVPPASATQATAPNTDNGTASTAPAAPPNNWVPGTSAKIRVLNKVDGSVTDLSIPVGGQSTAGDLQLSVLACVQRPPGQIPDSAIFLSIQSIADASAAPSYRGWMVRSVPAAAVVGNASETFRVISCS